MVLGLFLDLIRGATVFRFIFNLLSKASSFPSRAARLSSKESNSDSYISSREGAESYVAWKSDVETLFNFLYGHDSCIDGPDELLLGPKLWI